MYFEKKFQRALIGLKKEILFFKCLICPKCVTTVYNIIIKRVHTLYANTVESNFLSSQGYSKQILIQKWIHICLSVLFNG